MSIYSSAQVVDFWASDWIIGVFFTLNCYSSGFEALRVEAITEPVDAAIADYKACYERYWNEIWPATGLIDYTTSEADIKTILEANKEINIDIYSLKTFTEPFIITSVWDAANVPAGTNALAAILGSVDKAATDPIAKNLTFFGGTTESVVFGTAAKPTDLNKYLYAEYLYFLAVCTAPIEKDDSENWMNLFINTDGDINTGWEGYDYVLNRSRDGKNVSVEKFTDGFRSEKTGEARYVTDGGYFVIKLEKSVIGVTELRDFTFKWADNSTTSGNVMEFMDLGDAAPNDRFAYRYIGENGTTVEYNDPEDEETTSPDAAETSGTSEQGGEKLGGFIAAVSAVSAVIIAAAAFVIVKIKRR